MQEILDLLESMGFGQMGWQDIPNITGTQIGSNLGDLFDFGASFNQGLFQPVSIQQMQNLLPSTYTPFMTAAQQPLLSDLISKTGGKQAKAAAGGFAGTGAYGKFTGQAKDVYGKGMSDTLGSIAQSRGQQQGAIMDLINQWRETAAGLTDPLGGE